MGCNVNSERNRASATQTRFWTSLLAAGFAAALAATAAAADRTGAEVVKEQCVKCHGPGTANAPKIGDKDAWVPRFRFGVDHLVSAAIHGHGGMPPRGGKADLTDTELRNALLYMFNPSGPPKEPPKSAQPLPPRGAGPQRVSVAGMDVYFGRVSAELMRAYPAGSPESKMHGGVPAGSGYYHVNVSIYDSASQAPITGAAVALDVEQLGAGRDTRALEAVTIRGGTSYGGYVRLAPKGNYTFIVRVRKPGTNADVEAKFQERLN